MNYKTLLLCLLAICYVLPLFSQANKEASIFNGKNLDGWLIPENNIWWSAKGNKLNVASGPEKKGSILWTEKKYTDFVVSMDFKMGEGTVDSGIFLRDESQQIQIGESGSLKRDMTCSPYIPGKKYPVEAEGVAELLRPTKWNKIKVRAKGNKYTAWLNGVEVMNYTSDNAIDEGPIGLQLHGNRDMTIQFRKIKVAEL